MRKIFLALFILASSLLATVTNEYPSETILKKKIPIVDIRTPGEWHSSGLLKGAIPIMFFDERGNYNLNEFLKQLKSKVDTSKPFALICHSGARTTTVANYLSKELGFDVINLQGGMMYVEAKHLPVIPYK